MNTPAFTVHRDALAAVLARLDKIVEKRSKIPQLLNVRLEAMGDGRLSATATDLQITAEASIDEVEVSRPGATTVPADTFLASVKRMPSGKIQFESTDTNCTVKAGRPRATMPVLPDADFPKVVYGEPTHTFVLPSKDLKAIGDKVDYAMSSEATRYYLCGIYLALRDGRLDAVATDGHLLSRMTLEGPEGADGMPGIILPDRLVRMLGLVTESGGDGIDVDLCETFIRFRTPSLTLTSKLIDGTYPDYLRILARDNPLRVQIPSTLLEEALHRMSIYATDTYRSVAFAFSPGLLTLSAQGEAGKAHEEIEVDCDFDLRIGFNCKYVLDTIKTFQGATTGFRFMDPSSAPFITDNGDDRREAVIMPLRVS